MTTSILRCKCLHEDQDRIFGKGVRLHNRCKPKLLPPIYRCTVCCTEKSV